MAHNQHLSFDESMVYGQIVLPVKFQQCVGNAEQQRLAAITTKLQPQEESAGWVTQYTTLNDVVSNMMSTR